MPVTVAYGDGIGPEIMESTMDILNAAGANIEPQVIEIGEKQYLRGFTSGISPESWDVLRKNKIFLKAPITTPTGGGASCRGGLSGRVCGRGDLAAMSLLPLVRARLRALPRPLAAAPQPHAAHG